MYLEKVFILPFLFTSSVTEHIQFLYPELHLTYFEVSHCIEAQESFLAEGTGLLECWQINGHSLAVCLTMG